MKKVFFAFVATSVVVLSACNNKPAETNETTTVDTVAAMEETTPVVADTVAAMTTDSVATEAPAK